MSDLEAREWYLEQEGKIDGLLDRTAPLDQQARQAFDIRNDIRTMARESMVDQVRAGELYGTRPNMTWNEALVKYDGDFSEIIAAAQRSDPVVNAIFGLNPADFLWVRPNIPNPFPSSFTAAGLGTLLGNIMAGNN